MEYKTGSYIINAQKQWICDDCKHIINPGIKQFARVKVGDDVLTTKFGTPYQQKMFKRYHIECALAKDDLNAYEKGLLSFYFLQDKQSQYILKGINIG